MQPVSNSCGGKGRLKLRDARLRQITVVMRHLAADLVTGRLNIQTNTMQRADGGTVVRDG